MIATKAFNIVSHFKFEVGGAIVSSGKLQKSLEGVSQQAAMLKNEMKHLGIGAAISLTGGQATIAGLLKEAVSSSEDFYNAQRKIATLLSGNAQKLKAFSDLGGSKKMDNYFNNFENSMKYSKTLLDNIIKEANEYGINSNDFVSTFTQLSGLMLPKGTAGKNMEQTSSLARNVLLGSSVLGMTPGEVGYRLQGLVEGRVNTGMPDMLFTRLKQETKAFEGMTPGRFNQMKAAERVALINKGLDQFTKKAGVMDAHMGSLGTQLNVLKNNFIGLGSVFKELGEFLRKNIVDLLKNINEWAKSNLKLAMDQLGTLFKNFTGNIEVLYVQLDKLSTLSGTLKKSLNYAFILSFIPGLLFAAKLLRSLMGISAAKLLTHSTIVAGPSRLAETATAGILGASAGKRAGILTAGVMGEVLIGLTSIRKAFGALGGSIISLLTVTTKAYGGFKIIPALMRVALKFGAALLTLKPIFTFLLKSLLSFGMIFAPVLAIMRLIDSAKAQADVLDIKNYAGNVEKFAKLFKTLGEVLFRFIKPFVYIIDGVASKIAFFFSGTWWIGILQPMIDSLEYLSKAFDNSVKHVIGFYTMVESAFSIMGNIGQKFFANLINPFDEDFLNIKKFTAHVDKITSQYDDFVVDSITRRLKSYDATKLDTPKMVQSIGKVEIRNQFKENIEPDRVAVLIKDSFEKSLNAQIDTTARSQLFTGSSATQNEGF